MWPRPLGTTATLHPSLHSDRPGVVEVDFALVGQEPGLFHLRDADSPRRIPIRPARSVFLSPCPVSPTPRGAASETGATSAPQGLVQNATLYAAPHPFLPNGLPNPFAGRMCGDKIIDGESEVGGYAVLAPAR